MFSRTRWFAPLTNLTNPPQPRHLAPMSERTRSLEAAARQGVEVRVTPARHVSAEATDAEWMAAIR